MSNVAGSVLAPGTTVAGYRIEALIGRGGMGAVYRAEEEGLERKVALKVVAPEFAQDERFRKRFLRESRIAASLDHPHVIPIYQAGDEDGVLFLAMRYVEGSDLAGLLAREGALELGRALELLAQVAEALDAAHAKGLVHRDVKPSNVLIAHIAGGEHCYLADFGLTRRTDSLSGVSVAGGVVGTLEYVAPEQITGDPLDERADVYSFGCVLYECLTGHAPFPRATDVALLWAQVHEEATPPSQLRPALPIELDSVLARALAKEPGRRYGSAGELIEGCSELGAGAARTTQTNLPRPLSSFVGRERELADVVSLLSREDVRLLTLTGPGGTGKTRLALQAAAQAADEYPDGMFWVPLASARETSLVLPSIAQAVGAHEQPSTPLDASIAGELADKSVLVLLDNLEHLLPTVAQPIAAMRDVPGVTVLATSRERLQLQGEQVFDVPPLSEADGVRLFVSRATAVGAQVSATAEVEELCERLDQLPLALELAAARTVLFSPRQLLDHLSTRLDLLKGSRDLDPRQQTLRATIEWSHELLSPDERQLLRRLAVFMGACTFEAAEAVCDADPDTLQALLDKSLVRRREDDGERRYWMLETIREYALERLEESGEAEEIRRRHATHYLGDPVDAERVWLENEEPKLLARLNRELANVRGALDWAHETRSPLELDLATLYQRADAVLPSEGRQRLEAALANPTPQRPRLRARALAACGGFAHMAGDLDMARRHDEDALGLYREVGDELGEERALWQLATLAGARGDEREEARLLDELAERARRHGDPRVRAASLGLQGVRAFSAGNREEARQLFEQSLRSSAGAGVFEAEAHVRVASLAIVEGRSDDAVRACAASLEILLRQGRPLEIWEALGVSARALGGTNELEAAVRVHAAFVAWREARGHKYHFYTSFSRELREYQPAALRAATSDPEFARVAAEGRPMTLEEAIDCARGALAHVAPRPE